MAAVMCAAAVTTSAIAGGRARQLSRRVGGSAMRHPRRHARVTEAANAATLTAGTSDTLGNRRARAPGPQQKDMAAPPGARRLPLGRKPHSPDGQ